MKIEFEYSENTGNTLAKLTSKQGVFYGLAKYNEEKEPFPPSYMFGMRLAEDRVLITYYKELIRQAYLQYKGLSRAEKATRPHKTETLHYIHGAMKAITQEIDEYKKSIEHYTADIESAKDSRRLYIRSRSMSKEDRKKIKDGIKKSFETLSKINTQDKND